jgi:hypothetical protein
MKAYYTPPPRVQTPLLRSSPPLLSSSPIFTTPPPIQLNWAQFNTPLTIRSRKAGVDYIRKRQFESIEDQIPLTPSVIRVPNKVEKASETSILKGGLSTHRLYDLANAEAARKKRKEESGKVVQKYGEIYTYQAQRDIQLEEEEEKRVVNMREKRLNKPWRTNFEKVIRQINKKGIRIE